MTISITPTEAKARYVTEFSVYSDTELTAMIANAREVIDFYAHIGSDAIEADAAKTAAYKVAVFHQMAAWLETTQNSDLAGYSPTTSISLGDITVSGQPSKLSPRARRVILTNGLS